MALDPSWKAETRAAEVLQKLRMTQLPICPFAVAAERDIACQENPSLASGVSGCLMKVGDEFGIMYSSRFANDGFKRFTVGHELGHYFLDGHIQHLFTGGQTIHQSDSGFLSNDPYEREADAFAAGLLMPKGLFRKASGNAGQGLAAIESLTELCRTSLTATAIRYALLTDEPVAVVCSVGDMISFAFMSKPLKECPDVTWIRKGTGLPGKSATAAFNLGAANVVAGRRAMGTTTFADWFDGDDTELTEEVVGLGEYGRTLTVLSADSLPAPPQADSRNKVDTDTEECLLRNRDKRTRIAPGVEACRPAISRSV